MYFSVSVLYSQHSVPDSGYNYASCFRFTTPSRFILTSSLFLRKIIAIGDNVFRHYQKPNGRSDFVKLRISLGKSSSFEAFDAETYRITGEYFDAENDADEGDNDQEPAM